MPRLLHIVLFIVSLCLFACGKEQPLELKSAKDIVSFSLQTANGTVVADTAITIVIKEDSVEITLPYGTDVSALIPLIEIAGISISPESGVKQDFSVPVTYTVTAENQTTKSYTVVVKTRPKKITAMLYFGGGDKTFYALDPLTGNLQWKHTGFGHFTFSDPDTSENIVFAGGGIDDGSMYAFEAATGEVRWKFFTTNDGIESPPAISGNTVYFGGIDDYFYAIDKHTGNLKWQFLTHQNVSTKAVFFEGKVIFGSSDGNLYALDTASGELQWNFQMEQMVNQSSPVLSKGIVFIGNRDGHLYAVNAATGQLKWKYNTGYSLEMSTPAVSDGTVYIGGWYKDVNVPGPSTEAGPLFAIDEESGQLNWETAGRGHSSDPCVAGGKVFITDDEGYLRAYDAGTGNEAWKKLILANSASPMVYDNTVYVGGGGTWYFYALDANSGAERWKFPIKSVSASTPIIIPSF